MIILANLGLTFARQPVQIVSVFPNQNKLYVSRRATITAQFDTEMDASTINGRTFIVRGEDSGPKFGAISYDSMTKSARFEPLNEFFAVEVVTVTLTCSVRTVQQEPFAGFTWQFAVEAFNPTPPSFA
ncbi:MAG: Ig-like domain-containing protein, partial [bacterium]